MIWEILTGVMMAVLHILAMPVQAVWPLLWLGGGETLIAVMLLVGYYGGPVVGVIALIRRWL